jgi:ribosomal protein L29
MAKLKAEEIRKMNKEERKEKLEELKMEMLKARVNASKTGSSKVKQIKKTIARIITLNK